MNFSDYRNFFKYGRAPSNASGMVMVAHADVAAIGQLLYTW